MIKRFLNYFEDPKRPLLGPNYWLLTKTGLLFPKSKYLNLLCQLWLQSATVSSLTSALELYFLRSNMDTALTNVKITTLGFISIVKVNSFVFGQKGWKEVINYVTETDNNERATCDETRGRIIEKYTKYCRKITYFYAGLIYMTFIIFVVTPVLSYVSSKSLRDNIRNGTEPFPHIFSAWMPFDKNHFPGNLITVAFHLLLVVWGSGIIPASDTTILVVMVFFRGKLELLRERCKQMLGNDGKGLSDEEAKKRIYEMHQTHVMLVKHMKIFNSLVSPIMFTYVVVCSLMICASAYQLIAATTLVEKFLLTEYLIFAIAQLFLFCWHSSDIIDKVFRSSCIDHLCHWIEISKKLKTITITNEQLMLGPYESQWWAVNAKQRKGIMILAGQLSIVHIFTAGPFNNLTLTMFITVIKGAYSYFTLLRK